MKELKFSCRLLSDIIINQKAATEGPNKTLDYIPGSNFLGVLATCYNKFGADAAEIFHSGKVRFGDAHPAHNNMRTLRVPLSMYYPKLKKASEVCYIHHYLKEDTTNEQLKQCRSGFYDFSTQEAIPVKSETTFAIKSAHDKKERRSKEGQIYGYESLQAGLELYFQVEVDNDNLADAIRNALVGEKRVGRSRTAQYGLVEIKEFAYDEIKSIPTTGSMCTVYADSRLIFLDKATGLPTFQPTPADLGFTDGQINWEKSQIRTFQYAPWNYHRQCFDTDRCGIEKGSVFVIEGVTVSPSVSLYVGSYRNEGFGKIIYNAPFLASVNNQGSAMYKLLESKEDKKELTKKAFFNSPLLNYVSQKKNDEKMERKIYKAVNDWVSKEGSRRGFSTDAFASQWGTIRSIAMQYRTREELKKYLYEGKESYLTHGIAKEKWEENGRLRALKNFIEDKLEELDDKAVQLALVNLASEMAKKCKNSKK